MSQVFCPACSVWLNGPETVADVIVFCSVCGKCLQVPDLRRGKLTTSVGQGRDAAASSDDRVLTENGQRKRPKGKAGVIKAPNNFSEAEDLGPLLEIHRTPDLIIIRLLIFGILCLIFPVAILILDSWGVKNWPPNITAYAVVFPFGGVVALYWGLRNLASRQIVLVFSAGLVRIRHGRIDVFQWDQIEGIYQKTSEVFYLRHLDGRKLSFRDLAQGSKQQIRQRARQEIWRRMFPPASNVYHEGGTVNFGIIGLNLAGLKRRGKTLIWDQVAYLEIDPYGNLIVTRRGSLLRWASLPVRKIPNFFIFQTLVERHIPID